MKDSENMTAASEPTVQEREKAASEQLRRHILYYIRCYAPDNEWDGRPPKAWMEELALDLLDFVDDALTDQRERIADAFEVGSFWQCHCFLAGIDPSLTNPDKDDISPYDFGVYEAGGLAAEFVRSIAKDSEAPSYGRLNQGTRVGGPNQQQERTKR